MIHDQWSCDDSGTEGSPEIYCMHYNKDVKIDAEIVLNNSRAEISGYIDFEMKLGVRGVK